MSDTEATKGKGSGSSWTDRERLAYLVSVIEHSDTKLSFKTTPLPTGRSLIACERMFSRLKTGLKPELDALKAGKPIPSGSGTVATSLAKGGKADGGGAKKKVAKEGKRKGGAGEGEREEGAAKKRKMRMGMVGKGGGSGGEEVGVEVKRAVKQEEEDEDEDEV